MKIVCEQVFYEGLLVSLMFLNLTLLSPCFIHFNVKKKNILESMDGPYPQLTVQCTEVGKGRSPAEPVSRARWRRGGRGTTAGRGE